MGIVKDVGRKVEQRPVFTIVLVALLVLGASVVAFEWRSERFLGDVLREHFLSVDFDCLGHDRCRCFAGSCAIV